MYLHETLGITLKIRAWAGAGKLPYFLQEAFAIRELKLLDRQILLAMDRQADRPTLARVAASNARFDVLHFEQVQSADDDDLDEQFDPSALLLVLEALAELVEGVSVDPASGMLV